MPDIKLLDCTLRDGGFVNNWEFGLSTIRDILGRLDAARIDIIEVGFLDERSPAHISRSMLPGTQFLTAMFENFKPKHAMFVAMIDYGTCSEDLIESCDKTMIDGIRVIFKKKDMDGAIEFCKKIKDKGYKMFVQPVSITTYSDDEMITLLHKVNELDPYGMSLVDTYGLLLKKELLRYFSLVDTHLAKHIYLGYHAHNNFQLAYANCMEILEYNFSGRVSPTEAVPPADCEAAQMCYVSETDAPTAASTPMAYLNASNRNLILDSTVYGMGKGAGNAATELLARYLNNEYQKEYIVHHILEIIDVHLEQIYSQKRWGYSLPYYLAASNDCHPIYIQHLLDKKTLSIKAVNKILSRIPIPNKLTYNQELINRLYIDYQANEIDDKAAYSSLKQEITGRDILILAPGFSVKEQKEYIHNFILFNSPLVFTANFIPSSFDVDYVFVSNAKRYGQLVEQYYGLTKPAKVISTSNISQSEIPVNYEFNYEQLIVPDELIQDNATLLLINLLKKIDIKKVYVAGFDGFAMGKPNYMRDDLNLTLSDQKMMNLNVATVRYLQLLKKNIEIKFLTSSLYNIEATT